MKHTYLSMLLLFLFFQSPSPFLYSTLPTVPSNPSFSTYPSPSPSTIPPPFAVSLYHLLNQSTNNPKPEHEPEYFAAVQSLSDDDLTAFTSSDLAGVRVGVSAYGLHLFGKVRIPAMPESGPAFLHFRAFVGGDGHDQPGVASLHSIHTEDVEEPDGGHRYRAVFTRDDPLEWFDT
ncbi:hypothetical protein GGR52DRAFT_548555 [Hypoxylon sp. FL1284]|nr:hypothetical protein GGR52DRAFT_548555 [Hypoxylon sp. FL1284]